MCELSVSTIARGVPLGAATTNQVSNSYPGTPASATVGSSGMAALRFMLVTANARIRPALTKPISCEMLPKVTPTSPAMSAWSAGPPPLNCTATMLTSASRLTQLAGNVRIGADAGSGIEELTRLRLGERDQLPDGAHRQGRMDCDERWR